MKNIFNYFSWFLDFFSLILAAFFFRFSKGVDGRSFSSGRLTLKYRKMNPNVFATFDKIGRYACERDVCVLTSYE